MISAVAAVVVLSLAAAPAGGPTAVAVPVAAAGNFGKPTLYDLTAVALDGSSVPLASLRGNVSLVINAATY
eukprot:SAG31_NODE_975_length_10623_cov_7.244964_5_plen_71_part_00